MPKTHKEHTNEITEVTLPSAIEQVQWAWAVAGPGARVGLEICTRFVGSGAELQITLRDQKDRTHGTFKDALHANRFSARVLVPTAAEQALVPR